MGFVSGTPACRAALASQPDQAEHPHATCPGATAWCSPTHSVATPAACVHRYTGIEHISTETYTPTETAKMYSAAPQCCSHHPLVATYKSLLFGVGASAPVQSPSNACSPMPGRTCSCMRGHAAACRGVRPHAAACERRAVLRAQRSSGHASSPFQVPSLPTAAAAVRPRRQCSEHQKQCRMARPRRGRRGAAWVMVSQQAFRARSEGRRGAGAGRPPARRVTPCKTTNGMPQAGALRGCAPRPAGLCQGG